MDRIFKDKQELLKRIVGTMSNLGNLQIDKAIRQYCEHVWDIPPVEVPKPSLNATNRVRSWSNLLSQECLRGSRGEELDEMVQDNEEEKNQNT